MSSSALALTFRGDAALVTGAASGIGRACVDALVSAGLRVIALDRDESVAEVTQSHPVGAVDAIASDVTNEDRMSEALSHVNTNGLAYVVNCAGVHGQFSFDTITADEWHRVLDINLLGAFWASRAAVPHLRATGFGAIVNITSIEARQVVALINPDATPHYAASKAALAMLTQSMAHSLARDNIRVNAVAPGFTSTPMAHGNHGATDLAPQAADRMLIKRYATTREIAEPVAFLLSDSASYITATTLAIDGGFFVA